MSQPVQDLKSIRDQHYLNPAEFRKALHNDPEILKEDELLYLNRLIETEGKISDQIADWAETWNTYHFSAEEIKNISSLLLEMMGPLTPQAQAEISASLLKNFPEEFIQLLDVPLKKIIFPKESPNSSHRRYLPWLVIILAVLTLLSGKYFFEDILYPLGAVLLLAGAGWLYLRG